MHLCYIKWLLHITYLLTNYAEVSTRVCTSIPYWRALSGASDSVPVPSSSLIVSRTPAPDFLLLATELSRSPLLVSGTVCQILSPLHLR